MLRQSIGVVSLILLPSAAALGQWSAGFGPVAHASAIAPTPLRTTAHLSGMARFENPFASLDLAGAVNNSGQTGFTSLLLRQTLFSPAVNGLRLVGSVEFAKRPAFDPGGPSTATATSALSYRRGPNGGWLGVKAEQGASSSMRFGAWRQIANWVTVAVSSSFRRAEVGARPARFWTETFFDSTYTDTGGWKVFPKEMVFEDSGARGRNLRWLESEARLGAQRGRFALDAVLGWRPGVDSLGQATWYRATGTMALARSVALTAGVGTATRQTPFARAVGRYGLVAVRLAPAELVRPSEAPEITPTASAFQLQRVAEREYIVRVRLPRARTVELSGDFNGWQPLRLSRERGDAWVVSIALQPGTYRMNIRVDGEQWVPPPGTTAVDDEFNGKVGLVVVR